MGQILLFAAVATIGVFGFKKFVSEAEKVSKRVRRQEREEQNHAHGTLIEDPETGEYRPARDDEIDR